MFPAEQCLGSGGKRLADCGGGAQYSANRSAAIVGTGEVLLARVCGPWAQPAKAAKNTATARILIAMA